MRFAKKAVETTGKVRVEITLIKYLWVLILLPKPLQLCVFGIVAVRLLHKKLVRLPIDNVALLLCGGAFVQLAAIVVQVEFGNPPFDRVAAALNTCFMWFVGAVFYWNARVAPWDSNDLRLVVRYFLLDLLILALLYCVYLISPKISFTFLGQTYKLSGGDFMDLGDGGAGSRFRGFMETYLSPSHLFLIAVPIVALGIEKGCVKKRVAFFILLAAYAAVMGSHSRMGMITCTAMSFLILFYLLTVLDEKGQLSRTWAILCLFVIAAFCVSHWSGLQDSFSSFFNSRAGSNSLRFSLYRESLRMVFENQPLIGMGIKYSYTIAVPYGSHCTYIGLLYKGGLIGGVLLLGGLIEIIRRCLKARLTTLVKVMFLLYPVFLIFSDIDSANWVIAIALIAWGVACSYSRRDEPVATVRAVHLMGDTNGHDGRGCGHRSLL